MMSPALIAVGGGQWKCALRRAERMAAAAPASKCKQLYLADQLTVCTHCSVDGGMVAWSPTRTLARRYRAVSQQFGRFTVSDDVQVPEQAERVGISGGWRCAVSGCGRGLVVCGDCRDACMHGCVCTVCRRFGARCMTTSSRCASFLSAMYYNTATAICNAAAYPHHRHPHQAVQKSACHALQCSDRELALCKQHCMPQMEWVYTILGQPPKQRVQRWPCDGVGGETGATR
jgi:hypothetical protein